LDETARITVDFNGNFVTVEGTAPRELAFELSMAMAPVFKKHGMGLHLNVLAATTASDSEKVTKLPKLQRSAPRALRKAT
jgi:hypothetical protein